MSASTDRPEWMVPYPTVHTADDVRALRLQLMGRLDEAIVLAGLDELPHNRLDTIVRAARLLTDRAVALGLEPADHTTVEKGQSS